MHLTQLTSLYWKSSPGLSDAGLAQLTALQHLGDFFMMENHGLSDALVAKENGHGVVCFALPAAEDTQVSPIKTAHACTWPSAPGSAHTCRLRCR